MKPTDLAPRELPGDRYRWIVEVCLAFDCLCNTLVRGWSHETLSSRAWRAWVNGKVFGRLARPVIDVLFIWQTGKLDHCRRHHEAEVARAEAIVQARSNL